MVTGIARFQNTSRHVLVDCADRCCRLPTQYIMARRFHVRDGRTLVLAVSLLSLAVLITFVFHPTRSLRWTSIDAPALAEAVYRAFTLKRCTADTALVARTAAACDTLLRAQRGRAEDVAKEEDGRILHVFFRVSAVNSTFSGGARFMGLSKVDSVAVSAYSLGRALGSQPRNVRVTVLYDRLQGRSPAVIGTWESGIAALLVAGAGATAATRIQISHVRVAAVDTGNRGTNVLQFRLARELPCVRAANAAAQARATVHSGGLAAGWARARTADAASVPSLNGRSGGAGAPVHMHEPAENADVIYFVEDDYFHADGALRELLRAAEGGHAADAGPPPDFLMLSDFPERYYRGTEDVDYAAVALSAVGHTTWRTTASATMTFAARCAPLADDLAHFSAKAPADFELWLDLTTRAGARRRLVAPVRSLAVHGNTDVGGFPVPGDGSLDGRGEVSWCGLVACLRNAAHAVLEREGLDLAVE